MQKHSTQTDAQRRYEKRMHWRKARLRIVFILSVAFLLVYSISIFGGSSIGRLSPQINRAIIQVARLLPQLEQNEEALRDTYEQMTQSWEAVLHSDNAQYKKYISSQESSFDQIVDDTLSWMNRVTKLKVGRDGCVVVVSKEDNRILAHPDERCIGLLFSPKETISEEDVISIADIKPSSKAEDLQLKYSIILPDKPSMKTFQAFGSLWSYLDLVLIGSVIDYQDTYIICGVPSMELIEDVLMNSLVFCFFYVILLGLFIKWINLVTTLRRESAKSLRTKLISYASLACVVLFIISCYCQVLSDVTSDLKTMANHADSAVETLSTYEAQRKKLNDWLDEYYETQCVLASLLVQKFPEKYLNRQELQQCADTLSVKDIYVFDQQGNVVVTNSKFDHYVISDDPGDASYEFRTLLDGVHGVIQAPAYDERYREYVQYIGVSMRSDEDLCDGFLMIAVDPELRDNLLASLTIETVLSNLVIGLPEYAIAIDKDTLEIVATTGIGFKNASIQSLGLSEENLTSDFSGFLRIDDTVYYAGVSETPELYLVPIMCRTGWLDTIRNALLLILVALVTSSVVILLTLHRYQRDVLDGLPPEEEPAAQPEEIDAELEAEGVPRGLFSGFSRFIRTQEKKGFDDRWHVNTIPKSQQTPEQRIGWDIYRLLLVFCLFVLLPTLYTSLARNVKGTELNNLAYIISGNWQKGFNIFAITSCIFLLCAMYVAVVLLNRILYYVARVSDTRVETVCLLLRNAIKYVCVIVFVYYGLSRFGVQSQTLLASAGILSLMISLGAKDLVSDIIAGFFTLFEGSYKVGDFITVGSWRGTVVEIGLRTTKVRFFSETKIFNNSSMRDIINSDGKVARMVLTVPIAYEAQLTQVEDILDEELPALMESIPGLVKPPMYEGVDSLGESGVYLRITIYVENSLKYAAQRSLNREVKLIFDRRGIVIPFNQIVVHEATKTNEDRH